jgi:hypothetical protein
MRNVQHNPDVAIAVLDKEFSVPELITNWIPI